ncbi:MAG: histidine phosphatase family protein [Candidatus Bathyarchaeia archaeon]
MSTTILLIRHAYTGIPERRQKPESGLSKIGRIQAEKLAKRIANNYKLEVVYSSFYKRARETAEIIAEPHHAEVRETESLNEIGVWTSPTQLHSPKISPAEYKEELKILAAAQEKAVDFLKEVAEHHSDETIAVVTHGNMIRGIIAEALVAGVETVVRLKVNNASLSILEYDDKGEFFRLLLFNDTSHLA